MTIAIGAAMRFLEALCAAAPTLLCGLFVVGILARLLGNGSTRRLFGSNGWRALPQAWLLGMLLPVCSLGVIPVCREMRRAGVAGGVLLAFALSAPLFNPLSLMYGLTLSKPLAIFAFAGCSLVVLTFVGGMWDRLFPGTGHANPDRPRVAAGMRRLLAIAVSVCREAASPTMLYVLIGLIGVALLGAVLPFGSLQTALNADNPFAPLLMLGVGVPAFATPMTAMMQIGSMFHHGNSIGAAFVLLTIGAGTNLGLLAWVAVNYGVKRALAWLLLIVTIVLGLAYAIDRPLRDLSSVNVEHVKDHPHSHAFDNYCQPYPATAQISVHAAWQKLRSRIMPHEIASLLAVGALLATGLGLRWLGRRFDVEAWLESEPAARENTPDNVWSRPLPPTVLGGAALAGVVAVSVFGCYVYYPAPEVVLEDLKLARVEVFSAAIGRDEEATEESIDWAADLTRRLEVGVYIRQFHLSEDCRLCTKTVRDLLEQLDHAVEDGEGNERVRELALAFTNACAECRTHYLPQDAAD